MKRHFYLLILSFVASSVLAQENNCNDEIIMNKKGSWISRSNSIVFPDKSFSKSEYKNIFTRHDKIKQLVQNIFPNPMGFEPRCNGVLDGGSYIKDGPIPSQFNIYFYAYYCSYNNKLLLEDETRNWIRFFINTFGWLAERMGDDWDMDGKNKTFFRLGRKTGEWNGYPVYESPLTLNMKHKIVLIHRDGQLPYIPVTEKQYIEALKMKLEKGKQEMIEVEIGKEKKILDAIAKTEKNTPAPYKQKVLDDLQKQLETFYKNKESNIQKTSTRYNDKIDFLNKMLASRSENQLNSQAFISKYSDGDSPLNFTKFIREEDGGFPVARFNAKYFIQSLPRYVPQFMALYWGWSEDPIVKNPTAVYKTTFEEKFPVALLKKLIDQ